MIDLIVKQIQNGHIQKMSIEQPTEKAEKIIKEKRSRSSASKKDFLTATKPPIKRGRSPAGGSNTLFGGRKIWLDNNDPDLLAALDKIQKLETDFDNLEKEKILYECESKKLGKDFEDLGKQLREEIEAVRHLDNIKQELEQHNKKMLDKINHLEEIKSKNDHKIARLSELNEELRDLIEEERNYNNEEVNRISKACTLKLKQNDSK